MEKTTTHRVVRATDKVRGVQFLVLEMDDGHFAIGYAKVGKTSIDGAQRFTDIVDAYCEALERYNAKKARKVA
jgi:predicted DNA-binding WGR domain protein